MDTILLVDDDPAIREIFTIFLTMAGYRALTVPGGQACLELLKTEHPDLLVLDLMMEPMDGWETLVAVTGTLARQVPVIVITGKQTVPEDLQRYGGCIWDYRIKPVDIKSVIATFPAILEKERELRRGIQAALDRGKDPVLVEEYARTLRLVTVAHNLEKRRTPGSWHGTFAVAGYEERLRWLHVALEFAGPLPGTDEGG